MLRPLPRGQHARLLLPVIWIQLGWLGGRMLAPGGCIRRGREGCRLLDDWARLLLRQGWICSRGLKWTTGTRLVHWLWLMDKVVLWDGGPRGRETVARRVR